MIASSRSEQPVEGEAAEILARVFSCCAAHIGMNAVPIEQTIELRRAALALPIRKNIGAGIQATPAKDYVDKGDKHTAKAIVTHIREQNPDDPDIEVLLSFIPVD